MEPGEGRGDNGGMGKNKIWLTLKWSVIGLFGFSFGAQAQSYLQISGVQGSAGVGFTEYTVISPKSDIEFDRGVYVTAAGEKGFDFAHLYVTISLGYMDAEGRANYDYTNLSSSTTYQVNDVNFKARMMELALGLKWKLIDNYWFRPFVEGGGIGSWNEIRYTSKTQALSAIGSDYKSKDTMMGYGYYGEAGLEIQFSERFGVKLAGRLSEITTKELDTLGKQKLKYQGQTFYLSALVGF